MQTELILISGLAAVGKGAALGVSVKRDMVVLAVVGDECLSNVEYYIHESGFALRQCLFASNFRDKMSTYGKDFPLSRLLEDAIAEVEIVGFDPTEIKLSSSTDNLYSITKEQATEVLSRELADDYFLAVMAGSTDKECVARAEITRYYWESLRGSFDNSVDRSDACLAVARAYAALSLRRHKELEARNATEEERKKAAAEHHAKCEERRKRTTPFLEAFRKNSAYRRVR
jgi:hypothetical protein